MLMKVTINQISFNTLLEMPVGEGGHDVGFELLAFNTLLEMQERG